MVISMEQIQKVMLWGDSVGKGVIFDEARGRYAISKCTAVGTVAEACHLEIVNHSKMGNTISAGFEMMERDLAKGLEADVAVIEFGGNDSDFDWEAISRDPTADHQPRTPLAVFRKTLSSMVDRVRKAGMLPVLLTLPPVDADRYFSFITRTGLSAKNILQWLGDKYRIYRFHESYSLAVTQVAYEQKCRLIDLRAAFLERRDTFSFMCKDGIHPNQNGQLLMGQTVVQAIG